MKSINISGEAVFKSKSGSPFFLLGSEALPSTALKDDIESKINKRVEHSIPGLWATLGNANDGKIVWQGELKFSETGNDNSDGTTSEEVEIIKLLNQEQIERSGGKVVERFINFDEVDFKMPAKFTLDAIPKLRLTLFLSDAEGALVYYELGEGIFEKRKDTEVEYILPEPTDNEFSTQRDRLTYLFDAIPVRALKQENGDLFSLNNSVRNSFFIKILTFPRNNSGSKPEEIITRMIRGLLPQKDHRLLFYNSGTNDFIDTNGNTTFKINTTLKTLLLIHGTFVDTAKSYGGMISKRSNGRSWLQEFIRDTDYQQVLAFDHPTIVADAAQNAEHLKLLLNGAAFSQQNPVSMITTSRGGLLGKYLMNDAAIQQNFLPVDKAILIACANGVHYFTTGNNIAKFLSLFRSVFRLMGGSVYLPGILSFAQFSAKYFLSLPGSQMMTIGNPSLQKILNGKPALSTTKIYPIVDDWDRKVNKDAGWIKQMIARGMDKFISRHVFKGMDNDWVVAAENQQIMPAGFVPAEFKAKSMHTRVILDTGSAPDIKEEIKRILTSH